MENNIFFCHIHFASLTIVNNGILQQTDACGVFHLDSSISFSEDIPGWHRILSVKCL